MTESIPAWVDGILMPVDKLEVHRKGLKHKAVSVFVCNGEKVLLQRRAFSKYHTPGLWTNTCCTHPKWGEASNVCALRRLKEEMGIADLAVTSLGQVAYRAEVGGGMIEHELVDLYSAECEGPLSITPNPAEVAEFRWLSVDALNQEIVFNPELFTPWLRIYMAEHSEQIFASRS